MRPKLTIGLPYVEDFDGLYFTVQALRLYQDLKDVEIVIVDNSAPGNSKSSETIGNITQHWFNTGPNMAVHRNQGARYFRMVSPRGTAVAKNRVFEEAEGEIVLCMDSHILIHPGAIAKLVDWFDRHPDSMDIVTGPLLHDDLKGLSTHFVDQWRGQMWGIWSQAWKRDAKGVYTTHFPDHAHASYSKSWYGKDIVFCTKERDGKLVYLSMEPGTKELTPDELGLPELPFSGHEQPLRHLSCYQLGWRDDDEFEIPGQGCGLFACRKEAWPGFNPHFRGFGGEEMYLQEKARRLGRKTICLGFLQWIHRFHRPAGTPYQVYVDDKVRNYLIGLQELGMPLDVIKEHFVGNKFISEKLYNKLAEDPLKPIYRPQDEQPDVNQTPLDPEGVYEHVFQTKSDLNTHMPKLRELASKCATVTEFSHRRDSFVAFALGAQKVVSHNPQVAEGLAKQLGERATILHDTKPSTDFDGIDPTDLLFLDTTHTYDFVEKELLKFAPVVNRFIVFHDTVSYGERGEDNQPGLRYLVQSFMEDHPEWKVIYHTDDQYGLSVLGKWKEDFPATPVIWPDPNGPGSELKSIMASLGINPAPTCSCNKLARDMDVNGPDGCEKNFDSIVKAIKENADQWNWNQAIRANIKAGLKSLKHPGLVRKLLLHPLDPIPVLVREAIDRAREREAKRRDNINRLEVSIEQQLLETKKNFENTRKGE